MAGVELDSRFQVAARFWNRIAEDAAKDDNPDIADYIGLKSLLLCNESFASTNEREGSQIACGVIDAFTAARRHLPHDPR